jgi:hypothetical protein
MPFGGFLAAAAIGGVGSIVGGAIQADAQSDIAEAQMQESRRQQQMALGFAAPTAKELENLTKQVQLQEKMFAQYNVMLEQAQKQLTEQYGPAIMEQGQQFYKQLQGEAAGVTKSYDSQRTRQRDQLKQQLIDRMGPDALTSSAGVQALNQFDTQTSEQRTQIEEQSLNNSLSRMLNLSQGQSGVGNLIMSSYQGMSGLLNQIQGTMGNFQTRQANAAVNTGSAVINSAGAENVGRAYMGQAIQGGFQQAGQLAGQGLMFNALGGGGGGSGQAPATPGGTSGTFNPQSPLGSNNFNWNSEPTFGNFNPQSPLGGNLAFNDMGK